MTNEALIPDTLEARPHGRAAATEVRGVPPSVVAISGFDANGTLAYRTGGDKAAMKTALKWFAVQGRRLAKNPPKETGSQLLRKMRQGAVKS